MEPIKKQKLRVGILTGSFTVPEWFFFMIERINKDNYAEIVLIVKKKHELFKKKSRDQFFLSKTRTRRIFFLNRERDISGFFF